MSLIYMQIANTNNTRTFHVCYRPGTDGVSNCYCSEFRARRLLLFAVAVKVEVEVEDGSPSPSLPRCAEDCTCIHVMCVM